MLTSIWPESALFELMESLNIIEICGEKFKLRPGFINFIINLDFQKVNWAVDDMVKKGVLSEPETKGMRRVYFFMFVVVLWDPSLPDDETKAAAIFLSSISRTKKVGVL